MTIKFAAIGLTHNHIYGQVDCLLREGATLATYASVCKATGAPFIFPGSPTAWKGLNDITDARLLAKHIVWASTEPNAKNEAFNATNGDVFRWQQLWQRIADYFGIPVGDYPGAYNSLANRMAYRDYKVERFASINGLNANTALTPGQKVKLVVFGTRR